MAQSPARARTANRILTALPNPHPVEEGLPERVVRVVADSPGDEVDVPRGVGRDQGFLVDDFLVGTGR
jgi:hypothetical protein